MIRQAFDLNRVLGDGPGKSRDDRRHHAVDALAVALLLRLTTRDSRPGTLLSCPVAQSVLPLDICLIPTRN